METNLTRSLIVEIPYNGEGGGGKNLRRRRDHAGDDMNTHPAGRKKGHLCRPARIYLNNSGKCRRLRQKRENRGKEGEELGFLGDNAFLTAHSRDVIGNRETATEPESALSRKAH